jgi:AcrR family transcriptional regulator
MAEAAEDAAAMTDAVPDPPSKRRALLRYQRSRETRERLALESVRLFRERGFDGVTVEEICVAAGVSRSSFYFHFANKDALLSELDGMTARRAGNELRAEAANPGSSLESEMEVFLAGLARRAQRMPKELLALAVAHAMRALPDVGQLPDRDADFGHALAEAFRRAQTRGELPPAEDAEEMAAVLASMLMEGMLRWASGTVSVADLDDVLRWRAAVFLAGVRARG